MGHVGDVVGRVVDAPRVASPVADERGEKAGDERVVADLPDGEDFEGENGASEGRAEDRAEARGDARHEHNAEIVGVELEEICEGTGNAAAHLYGGSLAACGAAEEVSDDGGEEHERSHAFGDAAIGLVDLLDDEIVAAFGVFTEPMINVADDNARDGEEPKEPRVLKTEVGSAF